jgi:hypothetical protein
MNTTQNSEEENIPQPVPDVEEVPVREPDEFEDIPLPRRVTRETEAGREEDELHDNEDRNHGDEGIDDPPPGTTTRVGH